MAEVKNLKQLEILALKGIPKLTEADVRALSKSMPSVKIESDFGTFASSSSTPP